MKRYVVSYDCGCTTCYDRIRDIRKKCKVHKKGRVIRCEKILTEKEKLMIQKNFKD
jgi:hypothetical protein